MAFIKSSEFYFEICSFFNFCFQFHSFILSSVFSLSHVLLLLTLWLHFLLVLPTAVSNSSSPRTSRQFWVPRASVERWVYHIESDVENKTSRSRRPPSSNMAGSFVLLSRGSFQRGHFPQVLRAAAAWSSCLRPEAWGLRGVQGQWEWMKFPDAPPVFALLTLQLRPLRVHLRPRFTLYCGGLGRHHSVTTLTCSLNRLIGLDLSPLINLRAAADR